MMSLPIETEVANLAPDLGVTAVTAKWALSGVRSRKQTIDDKNGHRPVARYEERS